MIWYRLELYATADPTPERVEVYQATGDAAARIRASEFTTSGVTGLLHRVTWTGVEFVAALGGVSAP